MDEETPEVKRKLMASSVATVTQTASETAGNAFAASLAATGSVLKTSF